MVEFFKKYALLVGLALGIMIADQVTKYAIVCRLTARPAHVALAAGAPAEDSCWTRFWSVPHPRAVDRIDVAGEALILVYQENPGAAWSFLAGANASWRLPFFVVVNLLAMIAITYYYRRTPRANWWLRAGLGAVLGGALGNLTDRLHLGYVIDFIRVDLGFWPINPWPTWNVADAGITVGVIAILLDGLILQPRAAARHDQQG